ncbi:hypothetical protein EK21DRAFT_95081 [Setomelanomma holmii]|uniref:C2H2-type domain-containing protein n=1 Tax=Setomelanomma holmii TaxID=210430 RepID=A0A9P4LGI5_9PLEO|nr:hypothetical protein EK21DRAFT_95081 [Setomelanomma holmii]
MDKPVELSGGRVGLFEHNVEALEVEDLEENRVWTLFDTITFGRLPLATACGLRKYFWQHANSYGCTYPECFKRFENGLDWRRHEGSQHFQLEAFRCKCGAHFFRDTAFKRHLEAQHECKDLDSQEKEVQQPRIGNNCQRTFWCGLCKNIIELEEKRNAAWNKRFDHIESHIKLEHKSIEQWVCVIENKTKRKLQKDLCGSAGVPLRLMWCSFYIVVIVVLCKLGL